MDNKARKRLAGLFVVLLIASGCTASKEETPTERCNRECDNKEVADTGCDKNPIDAIPDTAIDTSHFKGLRGTIAIRRGTGVCSHIYWTRFTPASGNKEAFRTVTVISAFDELPMQESEPGNPAVAAWTRGYYAGYQTRVNGCVIEAATGVRVCLPSTFGV